MKYKLYLVLIPILVGWIGIPFMARAQVSQGGIPYTISNSIPPVRGADATVSGPSSDALSAEDLAEPLPYRFAVNLPVDLGINNSGSWLTTPSRMKIWRLNIKSPGAKALILYFDQFKIPSGGQVFVYNPIRTQVLGAFNELNNNDLLTFATGMIFGDELTIEYNAPEGLPLPLLHVSEVGHAYRGVTDHGALTDDFGGSGSCEVNVNCAEGASWQKEKRSVTRITVKRGASSVWCTGSLVNTTRNDGTPYVLTADHCGYKSSAADISQWIFYFNYEGTGCADPTTEPAIKSVTGATLVAHGGNAASTGSDFFLVLLKNAVPASYNPYYSGWSRETLPPSPSGVSIHHPMGDIKKISTYTHSVQPSHWSGNPALAHWQVSWSYTANGHGVTEGGSSGSPLFDNQGRLIGTLTGGDTSCDTASLNLSDYYGMFSYHWDQNGNDSLSKLSCWLDPDNTGVMSVNGWAMSVIENQESASFQVFPNPAHDAVTIQTNRFLSNPMMLTVSNIWGDVLYRQELSGNNRFNIDLSAVTSGIYLMRLSDGAHQAIRKIIVQK